ncbi:hypothetical protein D9M73_121340 [compost metagenome]
MLDLQAGVHFEEVEALARRIRARHDQLDRACRIIANRARQRDRLLAHRLAHLRRHEGRRCFLDHLLVPPLDRAFALAQINDVAVLVAHHLDFDVTWGLDELLDEHAVVAERCQPLALGRLKALAHILFGIGQPHPLAAAARACLHHDRIADAGRDLDRMIGTVDLTEETGDHIDPRVARELLRLDLVAHRRNGVRRRADKGDPRLGTRLGETLALGQEAVAGVNAVRAGLLRRSKDQIGEQIALPRRRRPEPHGLIRHQHMRAARIGIGIDRDRRDPHLLGGAHDAAGDFTTIGDQDFLEHSTLPSRLREGPGEGLSARG